MNIGRKNNNGSIILLLLALLLLVLLYLAGQTSSGSNEIGVKDKKSDLETPTKIYRGYNYLDIIRDSINRVYKDSTISIYLNKELNTPFLMYVYKDSLSERQTTDRFYLHVYLKDTLALREAPNKKAIGLDFSGKPIKLSLQGTDYYVFKRFLVDDFLNINNVSYINTGRFSRGRGRSFSIENMTITNVLPLAEEVSNNFDKLIFTIKEKDFDKIIRKRDEALENGVLVTGEDDLVKANVALNNQPGIDAEIRLKGDWTDHLDHPKKWSFRAITEGLKTIKGTRKFSIQHPKVRNYMWEWLFNKFTKANDLFGLRYDFLNVEIRRTRKKEVIDTISLGIMAFEEAFDKILIENNRRREGLILGFDESLIWKDRSQQFDMHLPEETRSMELHALENAPIKVYNQNRVLADPKLNKQFQIAKDLLEGLRTGKLKISDAFDIYKLTTFVALSNLFGGRHGMISHNMRIYYNPITSKLEPISFDSNSGRRLTKIAHYPFSGRDDLYTEKLLEKLELVSSTEFVNDLVQTSYDEISELTLNLNSEFGTYLDLSILEHNSNMIKKNISPAKALVSGLLNLDPDEMTIEIKNVSHFPVAIERLEHEKGKNLSKRVKDILLHPGESETIVFKLKQAFANAFVSKKNKKGGFRYPKDVQKLRVRYRLLGVSEPKREEIIPYAKNGELANSIDSYRKSFLANIEEFGFIEVDSENHSLHFVAGNHVLNKTLVIPSGYEVNIEKGFKLDFRNNASVISYSKFLCNGTEQIPIKFYSSDGTGAGVFVTNTQGKSILNYTYFSNLSNPTSPIWEVSGAVNFHEADVEISHSVFENNRCEDGLNIIRSKFLIESSRFQNTYSDAFDGDFVDGAIYNATFLNTGNDGIDISGSNVELKHIKIHNPSDKGISAGEASTISGSNIILQGGEIGIVSKDLSKISLDNVSISGTKLGFSAFQKKSEFGNGIIEIQNLSLSNNTLDYLIENGSQLTINKVEVETVSNRVIDQMYGNEYGKSSK